MKKLHIFIVLLTLGAILLSACGSAPASGESPQNLQPGPDPITIEGPEVPDYPSRMSELQPGKFFRGQKIFTAENTTEWVCIKRCLGNEGAIWGQTWVRVTSTGQIEYAKVLKGADLADQTWKAWRTNLTINGLDANATAKVQLQGYKDLWLITSPDTGLGWDYYWNNVGFDEVKYQEMLLKGEKAYMDLYDAKVAFWKDKGPWQFTVSGDRVMVVDMDALVLANPDGTFPLEIPERPLYLEQVRKAIQSDWGDTPLPAPLEKLPPAADIPPAGQLTEVNILSKVDGMNHRVLLNQEQLSWLRNGDPKIVGVLNAQGVPMPKSSVWWKMGVGVWKTLDFIGVVALAYTAGTAFIDQIGLADTVQTAEFGGDIDLSQVSPQDFQWLIDNGFGEGPLMQVYVEKAPQNVADFTEGRPSSCYMVRLDEPYQVNVGQVLGAVDNDVVTPIQVCGDMSWARYYNIETGEYIEFQKENGDWVHKKGPQCMAYHALVANAGASANIIAPFEFCAWPYAASHTPVWMR